MTKRSFILQATLVAMRAGKQGNIAAVDAAMAANTLEREKYVKFDEHEPSVYVPLPGDNKQ